MTDVKTILKSHGLRVTAQRVAVVEAFNAQIGALSYSDLSGSLSDGFDRVTLYRILKSFEDNGVIHTIPNPEGELHYALCNHDHDSVDAHDHHENHAHFKCNICEKIECIDEHPKVEVKSLKDYDVEGMSLVFHGTCAACK